MSNFDNSDYDIEVFDNTGDTNWFKVDDTIYGLDFKGNLMDKDGLPIRELTGDLNEIYPILKMLVNSGIAS